MNNYLFIDRIFILEENATNTVVVIFKTQLQYRRWKKEKEKISGMR